MDGERKLSELKKLSWKEKIQYCWDYYKWVIVVVVLVIGSVGIVLDIRHNMQQETVLSIALPDAVQYHMGEELEANILEYIGELAEKEKIEVIPVPTPSAQDESLSMQATLQLTTIIAAGHLDVLIGNHIYYDGYSMEDAFYSMEELLDPAIFMQYQDLITPKGDALMLASEHLPPAWGIPEGETLYLGILVNSPRTSMAAQLAEQMLEQNNAKEK